MIFSAYRKDDYADSEGYLAQLCLLLEHYDDGVIAAVSDPFSGIQTRIKFPPQIAEVKEALEAETTRRATLRKYASMQRIVVVRAKDDRPGRRANVLVHKDAPQYAEIYEWHKTADPADWRADEQDRGLWVALGAAPGLPGRPSSHFLQAATRHGSSA